MDENLQSFVLIAPEIAKTTGTWRLKLVTAKQHSLPIQLNNND